MTDSFNIREQGLYETRHAHLKPKNCLYANGDVTYAPMAMLNHGIRDGGAILIIRPYFRPYGSMRFEMINATGLELKVNPSL